MRALDHLLEAQAANDIEAQRLFNASPEPDSLLEYIEALPMPDRTRRVLRGCASSIVILNDRERDAERAATRLLDAQAPRSLRDTIGVKGAARLLRPVLGGDFQMECSTIRRLLADPRCGVKVLRSRSMVGQLGRLQHARLVELLDGMEATS